MPTSDEEITKLFRIRRTILQMLNDRGYSIEESEINMTRQNFIDKFGENVKNEDLFIVTHKLDDPTDQILAIFVYAVKKIGTPTIKDCVIRMKKENAHKAILVAPLAMNSHAEKSKDEVSTKFLIEFFLEAELLVNITKHKLVPKHELLTNQEKEELLTKYRVKEAQLPRIIVTDPVARYYGARRGQVMKITRPSETAGTYVTYRYVV